MPTLAHPQSRPQARSAEPAPDQSRAIGSPAGLPCPSGLPLFLQRLPVPEVQAKLLVNEPNDAFEQEADSLSESVAQGAQGTRPPSPRPADASQDLLQRKPAAPLVGPPVIKPPDGGSSLDGDVRTRVEPLLGMDLSSVRVHDSPSARDTADTLRARAFTHRDHIWLGPGESRTDERLIAHELTHVAQQSRGATPAVQRAPADYRHAEDGAEPHRRMQAKLREELGDDVEVPSARRREGEPGRPVLRRHLQPPSTSQSIEDRSTPSAPRSNPRHTPTWTAQLRSGPASRPPPRKRRRPSTPRRWEARTERARATARRQNPPPKRRLKRQDSPRNRHLRPRSRCPLRSCCPLSSQFRRSPQ